MLGNEISAYFRLRGEPLQSIIRVHGPEICSEVLTFNAENKPGNIKIYLLP
jgi:hypothetical protein